MNIIIKRFLFTTVSTGFTFFLMNLVPETHIGLMKWLHNYAVNIVRVIVLYLLLAIILQCIIWMDYYWTKGIVLEQNTFLRIHNTYGIPLLFATLIWLSFTYSNYIKFRENSIRQFGRRLINYVLSQAGVNLLS